MPRIACTTRHSVTARMYNHWTARQETLSLVKQAAAEGRSSYVLVNNRSEGCSPLTVQALLEALAIPTDSPL
ncbi:MAG: hypothetical protein AABZ52_01760 [Nitrospirota bacterium]